MLDLLLVLGLATAAAGDDEYKVPVVFVKDSARAASLDVEDPNTQICVRTRMVNSRTRWTKRCMTSDQWQNFELERRELTDAIRNVKGINDRTYDNPPEPR